MGLLERRRALLAYTNYNSWDGKECVAIGTNHNLYYSTDYGKTFYDSGVTSGAGYCAAITRNKSTLGAAHVAFVHSNKCVYFGTLGGAYNRSVALAAVGKSICMNGDGTVAYVPINEGSGRQTGYTCKIYKVVQTGSTCTATVKGTFSTWDQAADYASACSNNGKYAVIGGASGYTNGFQTTNTGETWTECLATQSFGNGICQVSCNFAGSNWLVASQGGLNYSMDSLNSWTKFDSRNTRAVAIAGTFSTTDFWTRVDANGLRVCMDRSGRGGFTPNTWTTGSIESNLKQIKTNNTGNRLVAVSTSGNLYYSQDWGRTWRLSTVPSGVSFISVDMTKCN